jgi:cytochrome P450
MPVIGGLNMLAMLLALHGDVEARLRAEIREKLPDGPITTARLRVMPYLDAVCKEARRVQPVLAITFFANVKAESSFRGVRIPAGIKAVGCIGPTLLDDKVFPDPTRFDPDRWMGARPTPRMQAAWVPHGAGERLADLMLKAFAIVMLRDHAWTLPPQDLSPTKGDLFATPRSGLDVRFRRLRAGE